MVDAAVLEKLEAGFQKLQAATDCKSLLRKYLTKEVFDQLKDKKTSLGATLLDVIQSGEWNKCAFKNLLSWQWQLLAIAIFFKTKFLRLNCKRIIIVKLVFSS